MTTMARYVVRVGYDWVQPAFRDVEVVATSTSDATRKALALASSDTDFWREAVEADGEAGATRIFEVHRLKATDD